MYGLYGLKHYIVEISKDVTYAGRQTTSEDRATQLLICETLSLAINAASPRGVEGLGSKMVSHGAPDEDNEGGW